ncbi:MAG: hydrogenase maturation peptidase HycI [Candidatus Bathyarchaeia archaeon]|nr:hydrogenase maturation peptidase HycI [Candidatus Bathyarchaeota archaeon]
MVEDELKTWLSGYRRLVIIGVGNPLRGDDSLGLEIVKEIKGKVPRNVRVVYGGSAPENFIGKIKRFKPSHVLIIDAALFGKEPGEARLIPPEQIPDETISTHAMPLSLLTSLIQKETNAKVILLGVEPRNLGLGEKMSPEVRDAVKRYAGALVNAIGKCYVKRA